MFVRVEDEDEDEDDRVARSSEEKEPGFSFSLKSSPSRFLAMSSTGEGRLSTCSSG